MKALYLSGLLCLFVSFSFSQLSTTISGDYPRFSITTGIGTIAMTGLPSGIDQQTSLGVKFDFTYNFKISGQHYLSLGLDYETSNQVVDGYFTKENGQYGFSITPPNYKQHELRMQYLNMPVLYKYRWLNTSAVSIGPFIGYLIDAESRYKISSKKYKNDALIENKFRWGLQFEAEFLNLSTLKNKTGVSFAFGCQYQLSNYLNDSRSFKPFFPYLKLGFTFK